MLRSLRAIAVACAAVALLTACPDTKAPQDPQRLPMPKAVGAPPH